jgi:hypothetical protein
MEHDLVEEQVSVPRDRSDLPQSITFVSRYNIEGYENLLQARGGKRPMREGRVSLRKLLGQMQDL